MWTHSEKCFIRWFCQYKNTLTQKWQQLIKFWGATMVYLVCVWPKYYGAHTYVYIYTHIAMCVCVCVCKYIQEVFKKFMRKLWMTFNFFCPINYLQYPHTYPTIHIWWYIYIHTPEVVLLCPWNLLYNELYISDIFLLSSYIPSCWGDSISVPCLLFPCTWYSAMPGRRA